MADHLAGVHATPLASARRLELVDSLVKSRARPGVKEGRHDSAAAFPDEGGDVVMAESGADVQDHMDRGLDLRLTH